MKTADELFEKYRNKKLSDTVFRDSFKEALKEHDNEIKELIDKMIEEAKKDMDSISIGRVLALTQLKNKAGL